MAKENTILLAGESSFDFSTLLKNLRGNIEADYMLAVREDDLLHLMQSFQANLIILNFENNNRVLQFLHEKLGEFKSPILCLVNGLEVFRSVDGNDDIIFRCPTEYIHKPRILESNVRSILALTQGRVIDQDFPVSFESEKKYQVSNKNLCRYVMELEQKDKTLSNIKKQIEELSLNADQGIRNKLKFITNSIKQPTSNKNLWEDFHIYFEEVNPKFVKRLNREYPGLTEKDIKYCCYLKMNMSNNDIKNLLSISQDSVRTHKYRLKKKMGLDKNQNLRSYLQLSTFEEIRMA